MSDRLIPESQLKQAVAEILLDVAQQLGIEPHNSHQNRQWYDTNLAYKLLGYDEAEQLRDAVRSGLLRVGYEVRDRRKPQAKLPRYQFHIEKCQNRLLELPEKRRAG